MTALEQLKSPMSFYQAKRSACAADPQVKSQWYVPCDKVRGIGYDYRHIFGFLISRETDWNDVFGRITDKTGMPDFQRGYHLYSVIRGESYLDSLRYVGGHWKSEVVRISHLVLGTGQEEGYTLRQQLRQLGDDVVSASTGTLR